jgi:hypothetical protein
MTLQNKTSEGLMLIKKLFTNASIQLDESRVAWGQFLDDSRDNNQYGIYGTSAGIQVLTHCGYPPENRVIIGANKVLNEVFEDKDNIFCKKGDQFVLYKLAYLTEAWCSSKVEGEADCPAIIEILNRALPGQGWGEYYVSPTDRDAHPRILATIAALISLRRHKEFRSRDECKNSLRWLCERISEDGSLRAHELALATLVLFEYKTPGIDIPNYKRVFNMCKKRLVEWANHRKKDQFGQYEVYNYSTRQKDRRRNRYLFILPDCITALVFLKLGNPIKIRRWVLKVIDYYLTVILSKNSFAPSSSGRVATVDHMWLCRLLYKFKSMKIEDLLPIHRFQWIHSNNLVRVLISVFFLGVGVIGLYLSNKVMVTDALIITILGGVFSAIGLALVARILWEWLLKGKNHDSQ